MIVENITPWESPEWDAYVSSHPGATVYHSSAWIRIVCDAGRYHPRCLVARDGDHVVGVIPGAEIRSRLTGSRLTTLPFSDECFVLADTPDAAHSLVAEASALRERLGLRTFEMRGAPRVRDHENASAPDGFAVDDQFFNYVVPLSEDTDAVRRTFSKKAVRQTINKGYRLGVTVRPGQGDADLQSFYHLYSLNRRRHGIPPQPLSLFRSVLRLETEPRALLFLSELEGRPVAALIVLRYRGVAYAKYEGIDETVRAAQPIYPLLWTSIEDACQHGCHSYDFGRTAADNPGLMDFKSRWGTVQSPVPYYFSPGGGGVSTVQADSLKYRLFTGAFRRMPLSMSSWIGARIFRHFG